MRIAICSWVMWNSRESRSKARACSIGFRSARCRFSTMVISIACSSETWRRIAGIVFLPANSEARQRRSPAISWKRPLASGRTSTGWTTPFEVMEAASSANCSSFNCERVWKGLRSICSRGISSGLPPSFSMAVGAEAAGTRGNRESSPLPRARRLGSIAAMVMVLNPLFRGKYRAFQLCFHGVRLVCGGGLMQPSGTW